MQGSIEHKARVLFLCTGNSCRSQMAEAIVNAQWGDQWEAFSAGSHPVWFVHPLAIQSLAEIGINHQGRSKSIDEFFNQKFDLVITLCDSAFEECPLWLGRGRRIHQSFPDPSSASGSEAEVIAAFRMVRDRIVNEIGELLAQ